MKKKFYLVIALVLALVLSGGTFAYTYTTASVIGGLTAAKADLATVNATPTQPNWNSLMPSAGTETLRPNAPGDETLITSQSPTSGAHWDKVDDVTSDGGDTRVFTSDTSWLEDLYHITDHSTGGTPKINYITVYMVLRTEDVTETQTSAYTHIKTNGVEYNGTEETVTPTWNTYSYRWDSNPQTGAGWTWAEIDNLQIGVGLRRPVSTPKSTFFTQIYVYIDYGIMSGEVVSGDLFTITPATDYTGNLAVKVYLTNTANLTKAYHYLNMKLYLTGSVEASETPNYRLLTLDNGVAAFTLADQGGVTRTLSVIGGSYYLVSNNSSQWSPGWTLTPQFYCEATQR